MVAGGVFAATFGIFQASLCALFASCATDRYGFTDASANPERQLAIQARPGTPTSLASARAVHCHTNDVHHVGLGPCFPMLSTTPSTARSPRQRRARDVLMLSVGLSLLDYASGSK